MPTTRRGSRSPTSTESFGLTNTISHPVGPPPAPLVPEQQPNVKLNKNVRKRSIHDEDNVNPTDGEVAGPPAKRVSTEERAPQESTTAKPSQPPKETRAPKAPRTTKEPKAPREPKAPKQVKGLKEPKAPRVPKPAQASKEPSLEIILDTAAPLRSSSVASSSVGLSDAERLLLFLAGKVDAATANRLDSQVLEPPVDQPVYRRHDEVVISMPVVTDTIPAETTSTPAPLQSGRSFSGSRGLTKEQIPPRLTTVIPVVQANATPTDTPTTLTAPPTPITMTTPTTPTLPTSPRSRRMSARPSVTPPPPSRPKTRNEIAQEKAKHRQVVRAALVKEQVERHAREQFFTELAVQYEGLEPIPYPYRQWPKVVKRTNPAHAPLEPGKQPPAVFTMVPEVSGHWHLPNGPVSSADFFSHPKLRYAIEMVQKLPVVSDQLDMFSYYQHGFHKAAETLKRQAISATSVDALGSSSLPQAPPPGGSPSGSLRETLQDPELDQYHEVYTFLAALFSPKMSNELPAELSDRASKVLQTVLSNMEEKIYGMGCGPQRAELTHRLSYIDMLSYFDESHIQRTAIKRAAREARAADAAKFAATIVAQANKEPNSENGSGSSMMDATTPGTGSTMQGSTSTNVSNGGSIESSHGVIVDLTNIQGRGEGDKQETESRGKGQDMNGHDDDVGHASNEGGHGDGEPTTGDRADPGTSHPEGGGERGEAASQETIALGPNDNMKKRGRGKGKKGKEVVEAATTTTSTSTEMKSTTGKRGGDMLGWAYPFDFRKSARRPHPHVSNPLSLSDTMDPFYRARLFLANSPEAKLAQLQGAQLAKIRDENRAAARAAAAAARMEAEEEARIEAEENTANATMRLLDKIRKVYDEDDHHHHDDTEDDGARANEARSENGRREEEEKEEDDDDEVEEQGRGGDEEEEEEEEGEGHSADEDHFEHDEDED